MKLVGTSWNKTELKILKESFKNGDTDPEIEEKLRNNKDCWNRSRFSIAQKRRMMGLIHFKGKTHVADPFQNILNKQKKAGFIKSV